MERYVVTMASRWMMLPIVIVLALFITSSLAGASPPPLPGCTLHSLQSASELSVTLEDIYTCALPLASPFASASMLLGPRDANSSSFLSTYVLSTPSVVHRSERMHAVVLEACPVSPYAWNMRGDKEEGATTSRDSRNLHHDTMTHCKPLPHRAASKDASWWYLVWNVIPAHVSEVGWSSAIESGLEAAMQWLHSRAVAVWTTAMARRNTSFAAAASIVAKYWLDDVIEIHIANLSIAHADFLSGGMRRLHHVLHQHVRITAHPPVAGDATSAEYTCDLDASTLLESTYRDYLDEIYDSHADTAAHKHSAPSRAAWLSSWDEDSTLLYSHCTVSVGTSKNHQHSKPQQATAAVRWASSAPMWLRRMLHLDELSSAMTMTPPALVLDGDASSSNGTTAAFEATCKLVRRTMDDAMCLTVKRSPSLVVTVSMHHEVGITWFILVGALMLVTLARPFLLRHPSLQLLLCTVLGAMIIMAAMLYYLVRDLQRTRIGQVGILGMLAAGGLAVAAEGFVSAALSVAAHEVRSNSIVHVGLVVAGFSSAIFSHLVLGSVLQSIVNVVCRTAQGVLLLLMLANNPEATLYVIIRSFAWWLGVPRLFAKIVFQWFPRQVWRVVVLLRWVVVQLVTGGDADPDAPSDRIPTMPVEQPAPYQRPIAASGSTFAALQTEGERFAAYNKQGSEHTRRALEQLACTVRENPGKYAARVRDPNGLARFAGV